MSFLYTSPASPSTNANKGALRITPFQKRMPKPFYKVANKISELKEAYNDKAFISDKQGKSYICYNFAGWLRSKDERAHTQHLVQVKEVYRDRKFSNPVKHQT